MDDIDSGDAGNSEGDDTDSLTSSSISPRTSDDESTDPENDAIDPPDVVPVPAPPWPPAQFYSLEVLAAQKKSLSSLQRSLVLCHEMDAFAKHTVAKLSDGTNKFQMMEDQQAEMEKDLIETADNFDDMGQCCGLCPWAKKRRGPIEDAPDAPPPVIAMPSRASIQPGPSAEVVGPSSLVIIPHDHGELQMEYEMELVEGFVDQLEQMSTDIQFKLNEETKVVDNVTDKIDRNIIRVVLALRKAKAVLQTV